MRKKISEWLKELPSPIRKKAEANFKKQKYRDIQVNELAWAIFEAFDWASTPEKYKYWCNVYEEYEPLFFGNYDNAMIEELVDNTKKMHKNIKSLNLVWDQKTGWENKAVVSLYGKDYVFKALAFKL